jgi:PAP2 superfamily
MVMLCGTLIGTRRHALTKARDLRAASAGGVCTPNLHLVASRVPALAAGGLVLLSTACSDDVTGPAVHPLFEPSASARWNQVARDLVSKYGTDPPMASRVYALLSVAQDRAVALTLRTTGRHLGYHAAAISASTAILAYAYPQEASVLDSLARSDRANPLWALDTRASATSGDSLGHAVAQQLMAERNTDGWDAVWTGSIPTGPGKWFSSANPPQPPLRPLWGTVRPWVMSRGDQFRPEPPPTFGSPEFESALTEVRRFSDTRTERQLEIAEYWADGVGTYTPPGHWNQIAADLATGYNLSERDAAHVLAVVNMAMMDAGIAVWDSKYAYWCLRPSQADPAITLPIALPNFPSYVSGHAGFSGAASEVLGYFFPREQRRLRDQAEEAAMSRVYGGIHFRFDSEVGLRMGRAVAALAIEIERANGGRMLPSRNARPSTSSY